MTPAASSSSRLQWFWQAPAASRRSLFAAWLGWLVFSGFGTVIADLYPTAIRATAQGFTYNVGRMGSALAPFLIGSLAQTRGFGTAFALLSFSLLLAASTWIWLPESRGWRVSSPANARASGF